MNTYPTHVCNYAVLRFLPYAASGEFVNVGVVAHSADSGWFGFEEAPESAERIFRFFPSVDRNLYDRQRTAFFAEVKRVKKLVEQTPDKHLGKRLFMELIRPRESAFRFGDVRTIMTDDLASLPSKLCEDYVMPQPGPLVQELSGVA